MIGRFHGLVWPSLVLLLAGCSAPEPDSGPTSGPSPSPSTTEIREEIGTVLASGVLTDDRGGEVGEIVLRVAEGGASEVELSNYSPVEESVSLQLSPEALTFEGCHDTGPVLEVGELNTDPEQVFYAGRFDDLPFDSKFVMVGLMADVSPTIERDCLLQVMAIAELSWSVG